MANLDAVLVQMIQREAVNQEAFKPWVMVKKDSE
jgi:hypothetical protein